MKKSIEDKIKSLPKSEQDPARWVLAETAKARPRLAKLEMSEKRYMASLPPKVRKFAPHLGGICGNGRRCIALLAGLPVDALVKVRVRGRDEAKSFEFENGVAVVPLSNPNSHDYEIGEVAVISAVSKPYTRATRADGTRGNNMTDEVGSFRLATEAEIISFFKEFEVKAKAKAKAKFGVDMFLAVMRGDK